MVYNKNIIILIIGDMYIMSLVQAIISKDFILVGADKRGNYSDGSKLDNCNKIIKLNNGIIFACTGGILDNFKLFDGYCDHSDLLGLINSENEFNISYNDFVIEIANRFHKMYQKHIDSTNDIQYDIGSIICGHNGKEFEVTVFSLGGKDESQNGIHKATKPVNFPYKGVSIGEPQHLNMLETLVEQTFFKYGELTIRLYKNIMLDVFEQGAKTDSTINNIVCFEKIRRKDVIL